ncbi:MAG: 4-hydroxythreonine-4-phosphate dehydrogenase PdxA [Longimicrobiales bacterium]
MTPRPVAVTLGDPRGIGPEVAVGAAARLSASGTPTPLLWIVPADLADRLPDDASHVHLLPPWDGTEVDAGRVSIDAIRAAVAAALDGRVSGVVTGPVHKPALRAAGWPTPGQTEMLRELSGAPAVGMLMCAEETRLDAPLRVLLATTHLPLRDVPMRLDADLLVEQSTLLEAALRRDWGIASPRLGLCALNPHASDGGLFGDEEARIYEPALARLRDRGLDVTGPVPADTVFSRALRGEFHAVVAPYHDVGMAAFKTVSFGTGVNVTVGLPFIRTSPDHGTALDIAGTGRADASSMHQALRLATRLAATRADSSDTAM